MSIYYHGNYWGRKYYQYHYWPGEHTASYIDDPVPAIPPAVLKELKIDLTLGLSLEGRSIFIGKKVIPNIELISSYIFMPIKDNSYLIVLDDDLWLIEQ